MILSTVASHLIDVIRFVVNFLTVAIITVRKNAILEVVASAIKLQRLKKPAPVENTRSKCLQVILNIERAVQNKFQFVECLAVRSYNVAIRVQEAAMKEPVLTAK